MIIDLILATVLGIAAQSFLAFVALAALGAIFWRPDCPLSSGLLKFALVALGISALFSLFGGDSCDCDL
jgi:hypothetical protein